jgi:DNA (cytosine-5)-methyltransferase 1
LEQISIFDYLETANNKPFKIDKPVKLIELFGGIGSQAMSLRDLGIPFESNLVEIDSYAVKSYNAIHGTTFEPKDIKNIKGVDLKVTDTDKYCYILCYSFPCQDLSVAGKQLGMQEDSGTRSSLLWEVTRILDECEQLSRSQGGYGMPQVLLMENVPQVHSKKNMPDFQKLMAFLESKGYKNYWQNLNAKDYGVPQSRNRCFMVSLYGDYTYDFPKPIELTKNLKDYLEDEVEDKYYLNCAKARKLIMELIQSGRLDKVISEIDNRSQHSTAQHSTGIDLCLKNPGTITVANCIKRRYDAGVSNQQKDGTGVLEINSIS